jgi:hypothetical protein
MSGRSGMIRAAKGKCSRHPTEGCANMVVVFCVAIAMA